MNPMIFQCRGGRWWCYPFYRAGKWVPHRCGRRGVKRQELRLEVDKSGFTRNSLLVMTLSRLLHFFIFVLLLVKWAPLKYPGLPEEEGCGVIQ
jgi:hypothetical protein